MEKKFLNVDYAQNISALESAMRELLLKRIIYKVLFRGKGLEFDTYRNFMPDDDADRIDWKASYRANKTLVRQYIEERDVKIMFVVDVGENMVFGSGNKLKCEYAAEVAAALSHLVVSSGDKIGFIFPREGSFYLVKPISGDKQFALFTDLLRRPETYSGESSIESSMNFLLKNFDKTLRCVFLISDFMYLSKDFKNTLNSISQRVETIGIMVRDPLERGMPEINAEVTIEDPLSGRQLVINPAVARKKYTLYARQKEEKIRKLFRETPADFLELVTNKFFPYYLSAFLKERAASGGSAVTMMGE